MQTRSPTYLAFLFLFLALLQTGCGGDSKPVVRGTVTYKDKALTGGTIHFVGPGGPPRSALIKSDGSYEIIDAPLGEVKVTVFSEKSTDPAPLVIGGAKNSKTKSPTQQAPKTSAIPVRYGEPTLSGLLFSIVPGNQTINIELKD